MNWICPKCPNRALVFMKTSIPPTCAPNENHDYAVLRTPVCQVCLGHGDYLNAEQSCIEDCGACRGKGYRTRLVALTAFSPIPEVVGYVRVPRETLPSSIREIRREWEARVNEIQKSPERPVTKPLPESVPDPHWEPIVDPVAAPRQVIAFSSQPQSMRRVTPTPEALAKWEAYQAALEAWRAERERVLDEWRVKVEQPWLTERKAKLKALGSLPRYVARRLGGKVVKVEEHHES